MFQIRPAEAHDAPRMFEVWSTRPGCNDDQSAYRNAFVSNIREFRPPFGAWVAEVHEGIAAFATISPLRFNPALVETMAEYGTYVDRAHQRRGIARALACAVVAHARSTRLEWILAFVGEFNVASSALFDQLGWTACGRVPPSELREGLNIRAIRVG